MAAKFFDENKDFEMDLMDLMGSLEEDKHCSGGVLDPNKILPLYMFSNVNNGIPKFSCHTFIVEQIEDNMSKFRAGLVTMVVIEFGFIGGFGFFLLFKCWKFCPSKQKK